MGNVEAMRSLKSLAVERKAWIQRIEESTARDEAPREAVTSANSVF